MAANSSVTGPSLMAANVAMGKGAAGAVSAVDGATTVDDAGGATVDPTGGEPSLRPGVEEHAASATARATTMTLPDLMITSSTFLASIHRSLKSRRHGAWNSNESRVGAAASITRSKPWSEAAIAMPRIRADIPSGRSRR
jgi:hypothetical protein